VVEEHDCDVRFFTRSGNNAVLRMRNEKCAVKPYLWPNRQIFRVIKKIEVEKHDGDVRF